MARFIEDHYEKKICMLILLITCSMGFTGQPIQSQIALEQHRYKVAVTISSDNESTKNLIESHIKRELRNSGYATLRRRPSEDKGIENRGAIGKAGLSRERKDVGTQTPTDERTTAKA